MPNESNKIEKLPLELIDDPKILMRSGIDDDDLQELMGSMREIGLLEPIVVRPVADRYEVIAGHRRSRAARLLGWPVIEAKIIEASEEEVFALRLAENLQRKDTNPVDEACYVGEIMLRYKKTAKEMSTLLKHSQAWVDERLEVFEMPGYIKEHLKFKKYPLGAALWISRIENEKTKEYYANWAAINGCTVGAAHRWYENLKAENFALDTSKEVVADKGPYNQIKRTIISCALCDADLFLDEAESIFVHKTCIKKTALSMKG